jgi:hypothetical protein
MLSFNDHEVYKDIIKSLLEANIQEKRYSEGSLVVLKSDKISAFNGKVSFTADASTVFVKVPLATPADETIGDGEPLVTLDVYSDAGQSKKIRTITWAQDPNSYYNHLKVGDGINWGGSTSTLETAQCIGVFYNGLDDWSTEEGRQKVTDTIISILNNGEDWHSKGRSNLISKLPNLPNGDFAILIDLIQGMNEFVSGVVKFTPHMIHGTIDKGYKKSEAKNPLVQVSGVKDNTADMIICDSSASALTDAIGKETVTYDTNGICKTDGGITFVQVSLKKAKEGAQLGKVTSALLQKHNISSAMAIYRQVVGEQYHPDYVQYLDEGLFGDFIKKSFNKLKDVASGIAAAFGKVIDGAKKLVKGWVGDFKKVWAQETTAAVSDFSRLFGLNSRDVKSLTEAFNSFIDTGQMFLAEETEESINKRLKNAKPSDITKFVNSITNRTSSLGSLYDQYWYLDHVEKGSISATKIGKNFNIDISIKLLANEVSLRTLAKIFTSNASNIDQLVKDMVDIQKEIFFGKTSLPLYKVYGKEADAQSWEYLGTAVDFAAKKEAQISGEGGELSYPISGFSVKDQRSKYYNIESWIITGVKNGASTYAQMRMGTNRAGAFSYVVEGTAERTQAQYNKKFGKK